jgi:hypothetical protein
VPIRRVVEVCAGLLGHERATIEVDAARLRRRDVDDFRCDATRLRHATGWRPTVPLEEGLRRTVAWYLENGRRWSWEDWCPGGVVDGATVESSAEPPPAAEPLPAVTASRGDGPPRSA